MSEQTTTKPAGTDQIDNSREPFVGLLAMALGAFMIAMSGVFWAGVILGAINNNTPGTILAPASYMSVLNLLALIGFTALAWLLFGFGIYYAITAYIERLLAESKKEQKP